MANGKLHFLILLATTGLFQIPSANSRKLPPRYRHGRLGSYELDNERPWGGPRPAPTLRGLLAGLSTPELLTTYHELLSSGRRMSDGEKLIELLREYRPKVSGNALRDRVDNGDALNPIPVPPGFISRQDVKVIRDELGTIQAHGSSLNDQPYLEKKGLNDFLVIKPDYSDPFHMFVPNDIYYNHHEPCVNWLDSCNVKGIRQKLLQIVDTP